MSVDRRIEIHREAERRANRRDSNLRYNGHRSAYGTVRATVYRKRARKSSLRDDLVVVGLAVLVGFVLALAA